MSFSFLSWYLKSYLFILLLALEIYGRFSMPGFNFFHPANKERVLLCLAVCWVWGVQWCPAPVGETDIK